MALTLNKFTDEVKSVTFHHSGESVTIDYYPAKITEKTFTQLNFLASTDAETITAGFSMLNGILASLVKSWDIYEDDTQTTMFPLIPDYLAALPATFRIHAVHEIMQDNSRDFRPITAL